MSHDSQAQITAVLQALERGDPAAADDLLPLVYDQLRRLARSRMGKIPPGQTLQPTALVHEAYLKLAGASDPSWTGRSHYFAAAAEAMRQILVDQARRRFALKRGGDRKRVDVDDVDLPIEPPSDDLLDLDRALGKLEQVDRQKADIVLLRHFAGLTREETAEVLGLSPRTLDRHWVFARTWLLRELRSEGDDADG